MNKNFEKIYFFLNNKVFKKSHNYQKHKYIHLAF